MKIEDTEEDAIKRFSETTATESQEDKFLAFKAAKILENQEGKDEDASS